MNFNETWFGAISLLNNLGRTLFKMQLIYIMFHISGNLILNKLKICKRDTLFGLTFFYIFVWSSEGRVLSPFIDTKIFIITHSNKTALSTKLFSLRPNQLKLPTLNSFALFNQNSQSKYIFPSKLIF